MTVNFPAPLDISHIEMGMFNNLGVGLKRIYIRTSLAVKWLRLPTSNAETWVSSLVKELKFHVTYGTASKVKIKKKKRTYSPKGPIPNLKIRIPGIKLTGFSTLKTSSK